MRTEGPGREVIRSARQGDARAFEMVVSAYGGLVLNLAWRMVRHRQEAEDLAQEVFLRLFRMFDRYDPERPFVPWLMRMATNLIINLTSLKSRRMHRAAASLDARRENLGSLPPDETAAEAPEVAVKREGAEKMRRAVAGLRADYREILALRYFEGRTYEELAEILALPLGTVKNRLFRAREVLAETWSEDE